MSNSDACTIFSAKDKNGNVWTGNNEDGIFTISTCVNIVASTKSTFGYIYFTGSNNQKEFPQGGLNDAGLFYDGNSVPKSEYKDFEIKKDYPEGINEMIFEILRKCQTVQEVFKLFKEYRLQGLEVSQFHFADKYGNFGIINSDSMWITKADFQISTNFNLCHHNKDNVKCWRYPIAERILKSREAGLESFREICDSTSQKKWTIYSNIQNLNTGDIWFYYAQNFSRPYKTSIKELLKNGNRSFYMLELFKDDPLVKQMLLTKESGDQFSIIIISLFCLLLLSIIYIVTLKRHIKKIKNLQTKDLTTH
jgi:hypothetical protein